VRGNCMPTATVHRLRVSEFSMVLEGCKL
jgi:hypothetical protein